MANDPVERFFMWGVRKFSGRSIGFLLTCLVLFAVPAVLGAVAPISPTAKIWLITLSWGLTLLITFFFFIAEFIQSRHLQMIRTTDSLARIRGLQWQDFERFVWALMVMEGYEVEPRGGPRPDGGVDLIATRDGRRLLVQCKHHEKERVGVRFVRELAGNPLSKDADGALLITAGQFTDEAIAEGAKTGIELIDGVRLYHRLQGVRGAFPERSPEEADRMARFTAQLIQLATSTPGYIEIPDCPACGKKLQIRSRRDGTLFWGCFSFPNCKGGRNLTDFHRMHLDPKWKPGRTGSAFRGQDHR